MRTVNPPPAPTLANPQITDGQWKLIVSLGLRVWLRGWYEKGKDRYFNFLASKFRLIMDFDDKRSGKSYGVWYSDGNPLTKEKIMPVEG